MTNPNPFNFSHKDYHTLYKNFVSFETKNHFLKIILNLFTNLKKGKDRKTEGPKDRKKDRKTERQKDRKAERQKGRKAERQKD